MKLTKILKIHIFALLVLCFSVQAQQTFKIANKTGEKITDVKISVTDKNEWTTIADSTVTILNNQTYQFNLPVLSPDCKYDFRFSTVSENRRAYITKSINLCETNEIMLRIPKNKESEN